MKQIPKCIKRQKVPTPMLHSLVVEHSPRLVEDLAKLGKSHRNPPKCLSREQLAPIFFVNWDNHGFMSYGATILG